MIKKIYKFFTDKNSRYRMRKRFVELLFRRSIINNMRKSVYNKDFTIISSDCIGGLIYHDLNMKFLSPTINMAIPANSFIKLCENIKYYMNIDPVEIKCDRSYPVMKIGDVVLECIHYNSFDEAKDKWNTRKQRINYDSLFCIFTAKDGFDETILPRIEKIGFEKVLLSNKEYPYEWCCYLKEFRKAEKVGDLTRYTGIFGWKYYDKHFNFIRWFNGEAVSYCKR